MWSFGTGHPHYVSKAVCDDFLKRCFDLAVEPCEVLRNVVTAEKLCAVCVVIECEELLLNGSREVGIGHSILEPHVHVAVIELKDMECPGDGGLVVSEVETRQKVRLQDYVTDTVGLPTLNDIMGELTKPGRDPREQFEIFSFSEGINKIEDVRIGMQVPGIVTNVTAFGAFVDIGVHQDGLVHISQLADRFVKDPGEIVKVHQKVKVTVLDVDLVKKRIGLSMKKQPQTARSVGRN